MATWHLSCARSFYLVTLLKTTRKPACFFRLYSMSSPEKKGLILGAYEKQQEFGDGVILSAAAKNYVISSKANLKELLVTAGPVLKKGKSRLFYGIDKEYNCVAVVGLGPEDAGFNEQEEIEENRENIRIAVGEGTKHLREIGIEQIYVDPCGDPEAAAEGSHLAAFSYDELKEKSSQKPKVKLNLYGVDSNADDWQKGVLKAEGQNLARRLMEMPANLLTPTHFAQIALDTLSVQNVQINARGKQWIIDQKMGSFLSVAKGSSEPPVFLEMIYSGASKDDKPVVLVGKGITFDSGGISIKPSKNMDLMRGDMGGGACVLGTIHTVAALKLPINVVGLVPLCENMPSGGANKPGDVVTAMNGKTIQVDNTDAEGRLILADALCYAHRFQPQVILDMATLTGAMMVALGAAACGAFSTSSVMWHHLFQAGILTGDRVWRMPLFNHYTKKIRDAHLADLNNIGKGDGKAGACTAAAFLKEFVTHRHWVHLDIAGVMENADDVPYLCKGMTGRPTRTIVEFISRLVKNPVLK